MQETVIDFQRPNLTYNHSVYRNPKKQSESFPIHSHNSYELLFFTRGNALYHIEDRTYELKKNDLVIIRPRQYHHLEILSDEVYERYVLNFTPNLLNLDLDRLLPENVEVVNCDRNNVVTQNFVKSDYYRTALRDEDFGNILLCLIKELLYNVSISHQNTYSMPSSLSPVITSAVEYINDNLFTIRSVKEISDYLYISETYFFKIFKDQLKLSPKRYIVEKRLLAAQYMIMTGKKPSEVYAKCGFETYPAFYKRYTVFFGHCPSICSEGFEPTKHK